MGLTSLALRFAAPAPHPESYDRILFIGPHPDDIEIGAGATAARLAALGKSVAFLVCLDGRYGLENAPSGTTPEALIQIRRAETIAGAAVLGVSDVHFLGLSDGGFYDTEELLRGMARVIGELQPQVLFAPDPCVTSECHTDHLNVGQAARRLAMFSPFPEIMEKLGAVSAPVEAIAYYMTAKPNRFVKCGGTLSKQHAALRCHVSQFPEGSQALRDVELYLKLRATDFGLRSFKGKAEGFRVLWKTQMHCIPEAGF